MKNSMKITGLVIGAIALAGCGTFKQKSVTGETGTFLVIAAKSSDHLVFVRDQNKTAKRAANRISCSMPSPDFLDASSTTGSLGVGVPRIGANIGFGNTQSAAFVGMRTQTVQLLRDSLFRLCEARINGALSKEQHNIALVSMPELFATMMAIDVVGGAAVAPAVTLTPAVAGTSQSTSISASLESALGADGSTTGSGTNSSTGSSSVTGSAGAGVIATVTRGPAINKDAADVLKHAMDKAEGNFMLGLCASLLADVEARREDDLDESNGGEVLAQTTGASAASKTTTQEVMETPPAFCANCRAIISRFTASVQPLEAKKIETEIDKLKDLQDSLQKAAGKTNSAELKALQKAVFDLATELSKKAVQRTPQIVVSGK
jgi:hypothetical protein